MLTNHPSKRHSLPAAFLGGRRLSSYHQVVDACPDDDDAIPLVDMTAARPSRSPQQHTCAPTRDQGTSSSSPSRPRRMYKYVSHGIGGAGNFRKVLTSRFRSDISTTDPSFARNASAKKATPATAGRNGGICACSRCFNDDGSKSSAASSAAKRRVGVAPDY